MTEIKRIDINERLSRVLIHKDIAYLSGLTADDGSADITEQTRQVLRKADRYLAAANTDKSRLLSAQIWLRDISDFDQMNIVWREWLGDVEPPSRATVESRLALPDLLVEIQFVAAIDEPGQS